MASHRPSQSIAGTGGLVPPGQDPVRQQRRMTSPAGSFNQSDTSRGQSPRSPSPLRNSFSRDTSTGINPHGSQSGSDDDDDDDPARWQRSPSPASSVSHLAASFVQRVNNFVGGMGPKSPAMLSDAELEAEAEKERDRSRREAEAIMSRESHQRQLVEDRVLEMLGSTRSLPPPPSRSQTMPNPPSPAGSHKETNWWTAAKNRLTPTKEPLTPAQQIIQDSKAREKEQKKLQKAQEKERAKERENEWPAKPDTKYADPAFANLNIPVVPPTRKPVPASPSSPTPSRPSLSNMPPNLTPSPMRGSDSISASPSRNGDAPPIYAQFNAQGALDVPATLLAIAKRFEKLEKWTVGHVRALEDRMNDVERWLVDKEKDAVSVKEQQTKSPQTDNAHTELQEMRDELSEMQGRVSELGREMAKLATAPSNLSNGPKSHVASVSTPTPPTTSSVLVQQHSGTSPSTPQHTRLTSSARESTSPPIASSRRTPSGTRLPYPTGDYASPEAFSPPSSPPGSLGASSRSRPIPISGLPNTAAPTSAVSSYSSASSVSSYGRTMSPTPGARAVSPTPSSPTGLALPRNSVNRGRDSVSPTPRKRYTVALGGPLTAPPDEFSSNASDFPAPTRRAGTPKSFARPSSSIESTFLASLTNGNGNGNANAKDDDDDDEDEEEEGFGGETIGKSAAIRLSQTATFSKGDYKSASADSPSPMSSRRLRAQSAYGFSNIAGANGTTAAAVLNGTSSSSSSTSGGTQPLRPKMRSKSSERLAPIKSFNSIGSNGGGSGTGDGMVSALGGTKFVDPLVLRKQSRDSMKPVIAMPKPIGGQGKVPVGQLVAFFSKDKQ